LVTAIVAVGPGFVHPLIDRPRGRKEGSLRLRFSILRLMALVLLIAVGLAAAMAGAFTFAVVTLSATTIGAFLSHGSSRAFFLGCTVFGWVSMLLAFGSGPDIRSALPTTRPIIWIYEAINGPGPVAFKAPGEASRWVIQLVEAVNRAITVGHSLISLALALAGGAVMWLMVNRRKNRAKQSESPSPVGGPLD
jgi:hypothetical protein